MDLEASFDLARKFVGWLAAICFSVMLLACVIAFAVCLWIPGLRKGIDKMTEPVLSESSGLGSSSSSFAPATFRGSTSEEGNDLGAISYLGRDVINWRSESHIGSQIGTSPIDVLKATSRRMQHLQGTAQASNTNAKALFAIEEAIQYLEGVEPLTIPSKE